MKRLIVTAVFILCFVSDHYSQDLKAGEIQVSHISGLTYEATVSVYQNAATFVNRPYIILHWGESAGDTLFSSLINCGDSNTTTQVYQGTHTYSGAGIDTIWSAINFRMDNIQNISNSINESLQLVYVLRVGFPGMYNSSPVFLNCAHDFWECCNWIYNPVASDPDLDSLSYKLVDPFTTNYSFPPATVDSISGDLTFNPTATGHYAFCMQIDEWRKINTSYLLIGTSFRQIQIDVYSLTGINENDHSISVSIFPNPFSSQAILQIDYPFSNGKLVLMNCFGQVVKQIHNIHGKSLIISRDHIPDGVYFIQLIQDNQVIAARKLIVSD